MDVLPNGLEMEALRLQIIRGDADGGRNGIRAKKDVPHAKSRLGNDGQPGAGGPFDEVL